MPIVNGLIDDAICVCLSCSEMHNKKYANVLLIQNVYLFAARSIWGLALAIKTRRVRKAGLIDNLDGCATMNFAYGTDL